MNIFHLLTQCFGLIWFLLRGSLFIFFLEACFKYRITKHKAYIFFLIYSLRIKLLEELTQNHVQSVHVNWEDR